MHSFRPFFSLWIMSLAGAGCADSPVRAPSGLATWTVSSVPVLRIGDEDSPAKRFQMIRGVARTQSGDIVVADGATAELRRFSQDGQFRDRLSRRGQGPGELATIGGMVRAADTLIVFDRTSEIGGVQRVHIFVPTGFVARASLRVANAPSGLTVVGRLASGPFVVRRGGAFTPLPAGRPGMVWRDTVTLGLLAGLTADTVAWLTPTLGNTFLWYASSAPGGASPTLYRFGGGLLHGVSGDHVWIGDTADGRITLFDAFGDTVRIVDLTAYGRPFSAEALRRARVRAVARTQSEFLQLGIKASYARAEIEPAAPVFSRFYPGTDGELWVELFEEDEIVPRRVVVFNRAGRPVARATLPARVAPFEIGSDYLVGVETDDDDVERVVMYRIRRS